MWHPIETRPDEGEFLAYDPISDKQDVCYATTEDVFGCIDGLTISGKPFTTKRGKIGKRNSCEATQSDGEYGPEDDDFQGGRATHWQPLPPKPVTPPQPQERQS